MARHRAAYIGERRTAHVAIHLTPTERRELGDRAEASGRLMSEFVREAVFLRRLPRADGADPVALRELMGELARVGNNLNQIARVCNQTGAIRSEAALQETIDQLTQTMEHVLNL